MPKIKTTKDVPLPSFPSLYSLLPSLPFNPYQPLPTNSTRSTTLQRVSKRKLEELEWWIEEGIASGSNLTLDHPVRAGTPGGGGEDRGDGAGGILKKFLEIERDEEEVERKMEWKKSKSTERWRVNEDFRLAKNSRKGKKGKGKGVSWYPYSLDKMQAIKN